MWIYVEDINALLSCYGHPDNPTPHLDYMAQQGLLFTRAYTISPVCSPARSGNILGVAPTSVGAHQHHSSRTVEAGNFLPDSIVPLPQLFRQAGYYTFNQGKDDYNFIYDRRKLYEGDFISDYWYTFEGLGHWRDSARGTRPFFGQIQLSGGKHALGNGYRGEERYADLSWKNPDSVQVPPYYPDHPVIREDWAAHHDAVRITDHEVGEILDQLKADDLLERTVVFFFSDHGYKGIRHKQFCYEGGIHIPLIIADPGGHFLDRKGQTDSQLVSSIDLAPTTLGLAGLPIPSFMEGRDLFGASPPRQQVIASRDRCDFSVDRIRAVRSEHFKYIRNYLPDRAYTQPSYRDRRPEFTVIRDLYQAGKLTAAQAKYWQASKPVEELFDLRTDPHEIQNLADDPAYQSVLRAHRDTLEAWVEASDDQGQYPENLEDLRFIYERWGERCVDPIFDTVKNSWRANTPRWVRQGHSR
ncbi:MAG: sulfatase [Bacteroidota bacterium]